MSSTYCHRCKRMIAAALPLCPHCGAIQDERSRAESKRQERITWLTIGVGAVVGMAGGWAVLGGIEGLFVGLILGMLVGQVFVSVRYSW